MTTFRAGWLANFCVVDHEATTQMSSHDFLFLCILGGRSPMEYLQELRDARNFDAMFEREELPHDSSDDTDCESTLDSVAYYMSHDDKATDELMKFLEEAEEMSSQTPRLICDESLYLRVAGWTKNVSNELGHMKIAFNALHNHYRSRVRLEKAKLHRLDDRACRRINELQREKDSFKLWQRTMEEKTKLLTEQIRLKDESLEAWIAEREKCSAELAILGRQNLRLQRQLALIRKSQTKDDMSIKQRPRRCSAPSVLDLTS